jgi:hypothetical protein
MSTKLTALLACVLALTAGSAGAAPGGSAGRSAPSGAASKAPTGAAPQSKVHGNSLASNSPQTRYGVFRTDTSSGKTSLWKVGVSDKPNVSGARLPQPRTTPAPGRDYSLRAVPQVNKLNADKTATQNGRYSFATRNLEKIPSQPAGQPTARQLVTGGEQQTVTKHALKTGTKPPGNVLPNPSPFSRLSK